MKLQAVHFNADHLSENLFTKMGGNQSVFNGENKADLSKFHILSSHDLFICGTVERDFIRLQIR